MKNLLTVLKKLGKKMTGEDITGKNLVTVVDDIAEKYTGGGGGEGGGGEGGFIILDYESDTKTLNKTASELLALVDSNVIALKYPASETAFQLLYLINYGDFSGYYGFSFASWDTDQNMYFMLDENVPTFYSNSADAKPVLFTDGG